MAEAASDIRTEAERLTAAFTAAGAMRIEAAALQPAETLLDLYGEDIRARAYVTFDPVQGEMMLRPDFTVPVVESHMQGGAEPARYTYRGPVWRKQEVGSKRASETVQVGYELFARDNPAAADAEVFALFAHLLAGRGLRAATGDLGILKAAIDGLDTLARRKAALARHIWRPQRFRALLERFGGTASVPQSRARLLAAAAGQDVEVLCANAGVAVGLRRIDEIKARVAALQEDAANPPISTEQVQLLEDILSLRKKSPAALAHLQALAIPALAPALERFEARLEALAAKGIDVATLDFEGAYGRTSLEYYDGFVFGFYAETRPDLPVIATGGRYDALTAVLGRGRSIPAVGGVIRPEPLLALAEGGV